MSAPSIFAIAGRGMGAQLTRLNAVASNLANAGTVSGSAAGAYRALAPVFRAEPGGGVSVERVVRTDRAPTMRHDPGHPLADKDGNVWDAAVDAEGETVAMLEASRHYQNNLAVMDAAKGLILDTLRIGSGR